MATIEITLRSFFSCEEADIAPQTTVTIDSDEIAKVPWPQTIEGLFKQMCGQMDGGPFTNLHAMPKDEVERYLDREKAGVI